MKKAILKTLNDNNLSEVIVLHYRLIDAYEKFYHVNFVIEAENKKTHENLEILLAEEKRREEEAWSRTHTIEFTYEKTDYSFCIQFEDNDEWFSISQYGVDFYIHHDKEYNHIVVYLDNGKYDTIIHKQAIYKSKPMK